MNRNVGDGTGVEAQRTDSRVRFSILPFVLSLTLMLACQGCCGHIGSELGTEDRLADEWIRNWQFRYDWQHIESWSEVGDQNLSEAVQLLKEKPFIQLSDVQVKHLDEKGTIVHPSGSTPYLLRAIGTSDGRFPLQVYIRAEGDVWIAGGAVGRCPVPRRRRAVVAWLRESPRNVYSTFSLAK